jgi:hypothetical protein
MKSSLTLLNSKIKKDEDSATKPSFHLSDHLLKVYLDIPKARRLKFNKLILLKNKKKLCQLLWCQLWTEPPSTQSSKLLVRMSSLAFSPFLHTPVFSLSPFLVISSSQT